MIKSKSARIFFIYQNFEIRTNIQIKQKEDTFGDVFFYFFYNNPKTIKIPGNRYDNTNRV